MSDCERCSRIRSWFSSLIAKLRPIKTLQTRQRHLRKSYMNMVQAGAAMEFRFANHEKVTAAWLAQLQERIESLENQNNQNRDKSKQIESRVSDIEEEIA